jgi:hypothetical protein
MSTRNPDAPGKEQDSHSRRERRRVRSKGDHAKLARREAMRTASEDQRHYAAMARVIVASLPDHAPGVTIGSVLEAARLHTSRRQFPGDTHRMWARQVLGDLMVKGAVAVNEDRLLYLKAHHAAA